MHLQLLAHSTKIWNSELVRSSTANENKHGISIRADRQTGVVGGRALPGWWRTTAHRDGEHRDRVYSNDTLQSRRHPTAWTTSARQWRRQRIINITSRQQAAAGSGPARLQTSIRSNFKDPRIETLWTPNNCRRSEILSLANARSSSFYVVCNSASTLSRTIPS